VLTRAQKETAVEDLRGKFAKASSVFVADYRGLSVDAVNRLRSKLREGGGAYDYQVAKNTLLRLAVAGSDASAVAEHFIGPTAVAFSFDEPVALAKVLVDYAKENEAFELKGGLIEGRAIDRGEIATLATLPSLDGLRGKLIGLLQAPAQKVLGVLQAPAGQLARVVEARRGQLEEAGGGS
jgi:large subunit ribosomal protein L10